MNYQIVDSCEWIYPDIHSYKTGAGVVRQTALRGSYATFQIHIWDTEGPVCAEALGIEARLYEEIPIPVESNPNFEKECLPHFPERKAPFFVNDCLRPWRGTALPREGSVSIYVAIPVSANSASRLEGEILLSCEPETVKVPVSVNVCGNAALPETLQIAMGYSWYDMIKWHKLEPGAPEAEQMDTQYLSMLRHQHQNRLYLDPPEMERIGENQYRFDFTAFNKRVQKGLSLGFTAFHIAGIGFRRAWDAPYIDIRWMNALSYEAYLYLSQYLPAIRENLQEQGWLVPGRFCIGIADEPNELNALTYRALCGMVRRFLPEVQLFDATSDVPIYGSLDIWAPRCDEYEKNRKLFDYYHQMGDQVWHYVCLYPRDGGFINRFMDIPLLATRYLYWGNYRYDLQGYLHWAVNCYQDDRDPFLHSCCRHINAGNESILPAGDDKLIYPGEDGPWMSMRLESHRESAEEYEMLKAIAACNQQAADDLCHRGFRSFQDVSFNPVAFRALREDLIHTYEELCCN